MPASTAISDERAQLTSNLPFVLLWLLWAMLLGADMLLGNVAIGSLGGSHGSAEATFARMGSSVVLIVVAARAWSRFRATPAGRFAFWITLGMALGTVGDFFNAGLLNFVPLPDPVLGGIAAFGLGHIAYITGCIGLARGARLTHVSRLVAAIIVWQLVGLVAWYFVAYQGTEGRALIWPALPYSLLLAGTAGIASGLAWQDRRLLPLAFGGALFLASDLILAFGMFRGSFPYQSEAVWLTYGPGQMLIVFSTLAAGASSVRRRRLESRTPLVPKCHQQEIALRAALQLEGRRAEVQL